MLPENWEPVLGHKDIRRNLGLYYFQMLCQSLSLQDSWIRRTTSTFYAKYVGSLQLCGTQGKKTKEKPKKQKPTT